MSLSRASCETLKLTAFDLTEIEEPRPGVFRHVNSLSAQLARVFERPRPTPAPQPDPYAWHTLADLIPVQTLETDR